MSSFTHINQGCSTDARAVIKLNFRSAGEKILRMLDQFQTMKQKSTDHVHISWYALHVGTYHYDQVPAFHMNIDDSRYFNSSPTIAAYKRRWYELLLV